MVMKSGQFYRGKIDGIQKHFESPDLDKILPTEKLCDLADYFEIGEYSRFFKKELVLAKIIVAPAENSDGRQGGVTNHTVLYQFDRATIYETAPYTFDVDKFIQEIQAGKRRFKMPDVPKLPGTDSEIIDSPPAIEWEVEQQNAV
jgi:hypothetical protein